ncbi:MAG: glycosyltransferase [Candidatus Marinimicrobia bacterium]|nr:glycosyltransferase [Candidatus Neomarinimicrobiota bacterium]
MKLLFLADGASVHTNKWVVSLLKKGHQIHLFSLNSFDQKAYVEFEKNFNHTVFNLTERKTILGGLNKLSYLRVVKDIKHVIKEFKPDLLHAHFATSYGMLAAKVDFHPMIISVWGYDVLHFPKRSFIHKKILEHNISKADKILSTSHMMAKETKLYTDKPIEVTPFGIDMEIFKPSDKTFPSLDRDSFIIGTAKALEDKYAIDDLIRSFTILVHRHPEKQLQLAIAGDGSSEDKLHELASSLGVTEKTVFLGRVNHRDIPDFYNSIDVFATLSLEDSFGVSVIEAGACGKPVVVTNVEGLPEVVEKDKTGYVVPKRNPEKAADAFEALLLDKSLRKEMGNAGRQRIMLHYNWDNCVDQMHNIYLDMVNKC